MSNLTSRSDFDLRYYADPDATPEHPDLQFVRRCSCALELLLGEIAEFPVLPIHGHLEPKDLAIAQEYALRTVHEFRNNLIDVAGIRLNEIAKKLGDPLDWGMLWIESLRGMAFKRNMLTSVYADLQTRSIRLGTWVDILSATVPDGKSTQTSDRVDAPVKPPSTEPPEGNGVDSQGDDCQAVEDAADCVLSLPQRARDILRVMLREGMTSPGTAWSQDNIADEVRRGFNRESIKNPLAKLRKLGLISATYQGAGSGTYLTIEGIAAAERLTVPKGGK